MFINGLRIIKAFLFDKKERGLILGSHKAVLRAYELLKKNNTNIRGFICLSEKKALSKLKNKPVYNLDKINKYLISLLKVHQVIIVNKDILPKELMLIVEILSRLKLDIKVIPSAALDKKVLNEPRKFNINDVFDVAQNNKKAVFVKKEFFNKTIFITGAAGSIGSEITRQLVRLNCKKVVLVDQAESDLYNLQQSLEQKKRANNVVIIADVRNKYRVNEVFKTYHPDIVFHAAAYKHVPLMEDNPYEAVHANILGTQIVADLSLQYQVEKFVMISTDKAVNPTNVMGATKRVAEMYINCLNSQGKTKFITTRFGNVLGSNGSVIPLFKSQIENGGPLTVTHKDITRYFMTIPEACQLVLEAGAMGNGGELFVFDMGESMKIYDLAKNMIHLSGFQFPEDIDIKITGLRPGEKLYEELLTDTEKNLPTYNDKIKIAQQSPIDCDRLRSGIIKLRSLKNEDANALVAQLKNIVPEYISNNSVFEKLDKKQSVLEEAK